ncbi:ParA family protein [Periweissella fabalis]|uniref:AAA family ATPase n=1 Tax=Periweissella fabalis TaxID=1070421 RepID=A0A7X6S483_9LACO|nr:AAA family ATPase [Periweissella fabalis]MCM0598394.1 AAA family ATPase [Periweissella fabalis]NKZ24996.1 AAA family ATPase [Periweissella fabalis]
MSAKIIVYTNHKGGTGKTTTATMTGLGFSRKGLKTLLLDLDPQANATDLYFKTKTLITEKVESFDTTLLKAIQNQDLASAIVKLNNNLDFIPSSADFSLYPRYMEDMFEDYTERVKYLSTLIEPLREQYDIIIIDLPPTISLITDSALYACDWAIPVMQTHERSYQGIESVIDYMQNTIINEFKAPNLQILAILAVLLKNGAPIDISTLKQAKDEFGEDNFFKTTVRNMERLKRYDVTGVTSKDQYDKKVSAVYDGIVNEIIERMGDNK